MSAIEQYVNTDFQRLYVMAYDRKDKEDAYYFESVDEAYAYVMELFEKRFGEKVNLNTYSGGQFILDSPILYLESVRMNWKPGMKANSICVCKRSITMQQYIGQGPAANERQAQPACSGLCCRVLAGSSAAAGVAAPSGLSVGRVQLFAAFAALAGAGALVGSPSGTGGWCASSSARKGLWVSRAGQPAQGCRLPQSVAIAASARGPYR